MGLHAARCHGLKIFCQVGAERSSKKGRVSGIMQGRCPGPMLFLASF